MARGAGREPQVTVVIPAYRAATFIKRAIDSALDQEDVAVDVIVVDDASPDDTVEVVRALQADRPRLHLVSLPTNGGPSVARNAGFRAARSSWVAVLDADDAFVQGRLGKLIEAGNAHQADVVADNVRYVDAIRQVKSGPALTSYTRPTLLTLEEFTSKARPETGELDLGLLKPVYRREYLESNQICYPEGVRHGEDFTLYFNLILSGARFLVLPEVGYEWTLRNSGKSRTLVDYSAQEIETLRLAAMPSVAKNSELVRLLGRRRQALKRLRQKNAFGAAADDRDFKRMLMLVSRHPRFARWFVSRVVSEVRAIFASGASSSA